METPEAERALTEAKIELDEAEREFTEPKDRKIIAEDKFKESSQKAERLKAAIAKQAEDDFAASTGAAHPIPPDGSASNVPGSNLPARNGITASTTNGTSTNGGPVSNGGPVNGAASLIEPINGAVDTGGSDTAQTNGISGIGTAKNDDQSLWYEFKGEFYLHGMMDGEAMREKFYKDLRDRVYELR